jgi:methionyl-tRNA formyltransferase
MNIVFMGYNLMGYYTLEYFLEQNEQVCAVFTHRDKAGDKIYFPSVAALAHKYNVPVYFAEDYSKEEIVLKIQTHSPNLIFSAYYKNIISPEILKIPTRGAYNIHGSLLPKFRGRCPANWQILMGEIQSGVTLHVLEPKADTGARVGQTVVPIEHRETAGSLNEKQVSAAVLLLREVFPKLKAGAISLTPQSSQQVSKFGGRKPDDGLIDWHCSAVEIDRLVRAVTHPFPGAFSFWNDRKIFIWNSYPLAGHSNRPGEIVGRTRHGFAVATKAGFLEVLRAQIEGEEEFHAYEFWEKYNMQSGIVLKSPNSTPSPI